jgi:hypothetical protein
VVSTSEMAHSSASPFALSAGTLVPAWSCFRLLRDSSIEPTCRRCGWDVLCWLKQHGRQVGATQMWLETEFDSRATTTCDATSSTLGEPEHDARESAERSHESARLRTVT